MKSRAWIVLSLAGLALAGCETPDKAGWDRNRIIAMAGEEAGQIAAPKERLTRQLNIAYQQSNAGRASDARATLISARKTLESAADKLGDQERLSGWISIAELSRQSQDTGGAGSALDVALRELRALNPDSARANFVLGVVREVKAQRGDGPAAKLLVEGGDWAAKIPDQSTRRDGLVAITTDLFLCGDYDGGRTVLRHDDDAAWRSDSLAAIAGNPVLVGSGGTFGVAAAAMDSASQKGGKRFGIYLDFKSNYFRP